MSNNKLTIFFLIIFSPLSLFGQNVDSIIRDIRSEYNIIVNNKDSYKKVVLIIDVYFGEYEDSELDREKIITYYIDEKNKQIKLISLFDMWAHHFSVNGTLTEYYLKDGNLFFIYQQNKYVLGHGQPPDVIENRLTEVTERRIYTVGNINSLDKKNCVRYLVKSLEGKLSDINELSQHTANVETDCNMSTSYISFSVEELLDIFYGRDESVKLSDEPLSFLSLYYYNMLFGQ